MSKKADDTDAGGASNLSQTDRDALLAHLVTLRLPFTLASYLSFAQIAADKQWSHLQFLQELIPVSYTHLDVYKRQQYRISKEFENLR